jgi:predicted RNase H-like nuclease
VTAQRVLGVDACKAGWVGVVLDGADVQVVVAPDIDSLVSMASRSGTPLVMAIDIPIGVPDSGRRQADVLAKAAIGPLQSSVFMTPVREALLAGDHASAVVTNRRLAGEGVSIQAFGLRTKLLQVETWALHTKHRVIEVHPEVSFARLAGQPLTVRKSTWAGMHRRRELLAGPTSISTRISGSQVPPPASTTLSMLPSRPGLRVATLQERHQSLPDPPAVFSDGLPCAIWA